MSHQSYRWQASPATLPVPVFSQSPTPLAPQGTYCTKVTLFPALSNTATINIGPSNMTVTVGGRPNVSQFQLDAGRSCQIYVTQPYDEDFDLGKFFACQNDAATTQYLFVTIWNITGGGSN